MLVYWKQIHPGSGIPTHHGQSCYLRASIHCVSKYKSRIKNTKDWFTPTRQAEFLVKFCHQKIDVLLRAWLPRCGSCGVTCLYLFAFSLLPFWCEEHNTVSVRLCSLKSLPLSCEPATERKACTILNRGWTEPELKWTSHLLCITHWWQSVTNASLCACVCNV